MVLVQNCVSSIIHTRLTCIMLTILSGKSHAIGFLIGLGMSSFNRAIFVGSDNYEIRISSTT